MGTWEPRADEFGLVDNTIPLSGAVAERTVGSGGFGHTQIRGTARVRFIRLSSQRNDTCSPVHPPSRQRGRHRGVLAGCYRAGLLGHERSLRKASDSLHGDLPPRE